MKTTMSPRSGRLARAAALCAGLAALVPAGLGAFDDRHGLPVLDIGGSRVHLRAVGCSALQRAGSIVVTGTISNGSSELARRVEVIAELIHRDGTPLDRESALVRSVDIGPGDRSPFRIVLDDRAGVAGVHVRTRPLAWDSLTPRVPSLSAAKP